MNDGVESPNKQKEVEFIFWSQTLFLYKFDVVSSKYIFKKIAAVNECLKFSNSNFALQSYNIYNMFLLILSQNTSPMLAKWFLLSIAACPCNPNGFYHCSKKNGHCSCYKGYEGPNCYQCTKGYYKVSDNECKGILFILFSVIIFIVNLFGMCVGGGGGQQLQ